MTGSFRVVIAGGGRVGRETARLLDDRGHDVVVVEREQQRADRISDDYVATVITGDATRPSILRQADPGASDVVAALTEFTGTNLAICMLATDMAPDVQTVMRTDREPAAEFSEYVDTVVYPERAGARSAANAIEPSVSSFEDVSGSLELLQVRVSEDAPVAGRTLSEISLPRGSLIVSDDDGDDIAGPETTLDPGCVYVVATEPAVVDEVINLMRG